MVCLPTDPYPTCIEPTNRHFLASPMWLWTCTKCWCIRWCKLQSKHRVRKFSIRVSSTLNVQCLKLTAKFSRKQSDVSLKLPAVIMCWPMFCICDSLAHVTLSCCTGIVKTWFASGLSVCCAPFHLGPSRTSHSRLTNLCAPPPSFFGNQGVMQFQAWLFATWLCIVAQIPTDMAQTLPKIAQIPITFAEDRSTRIVLA